MLPSGTVTFLFTDIEASVSLWERSRELMAEALQIHNTLLRQVIESNDGLVFKEVGDAFQAVFTTVSHALQAALEVQRDLQTAGWNALGPLKVRMGLHTGEAELDPQGDEYLVSHTKNRVARIMSAGHGGQILLSRAVAELLLGQLPDGVSLKDMGEHYLKGLLHPEHIFQVVAPDLPVNFPPLVSGDPQSNLPVQTTPFYGRESELSQIESLLGDPDCRLITLTGIGGSGKTRLAIQAARQNRVFHGNVYFIGLATSMAQDDLVFSIAEAVQYSFRVPQGSNLPLEEAQDQLLQYMADQKALLLLDNFEQLTEQSDFVANMLTSAVQVKLVVTSRERLNLPGEWVLEISGLAYPIQVDHGSILEYPAVQLFIKAAERVGNFSATQTDWPAIAVICQRLEGMPLGIEMAAGWVKMLSCQEIAAEIERDLDFLAATWRGVPERHSTLRAVFETSWRLLPQDEREAFYRLAVFRGGFRRESAQSVANASLLMLSTLVDKSFIRRVASGRFEIHPILKQYAVEKLEADLAALTEARTRHAQYFSEWLSRMYERLKGEQQTTALAEVRAETRNLRAACQELVEQRDFEQMERIFPALILFYEMNNRRVEAQEVIQVFMHMQQLLRDEMATTSKADDPARWAFYSGILALTLAALHHFTLTFQHSKYTVSFQQESLDLIEDLPDSEAKAYTILLNCIGLGLASDFKLDLCQQCFRIFRGMGDTWGGALAQLIWADEMNATNFDIDMARAAYQASLSTFTRAKNLWGQALALNGLTMVAQKTGNLEEACRLGNQSLEYFIQLENPERTAWVHDSLGTIALERGAPEDARIHFAANLEYYTQQGEKDRQRYYQDRLAKLDSSQTS